MSLREEALHLHKVNQGKLESKSKVEVRNAKDLASLILRVLQNRVRIFMKTLTKYMIIQ